MNTSPIKRHNSLQSFSRDHHHGLLLCWKIREGCRRNIDPERIKRYTDWFWQQQQPAALQAIAKALDTHIRFEERVLFNKIQEIATPEQFILLADLHKDTFCEDWDDAFWLKK